MLNMCFLLDQISVLWAFEQNTIKIYNIFSHKINAYTSKP